MHKSIYVIMLQSFLVKIKYKESGSDYMKRLSSHSIKSSEYQKFSVKKFGRIKNTNFCSTVIFQQLCSEFKK